MSVRNAVFELLRQRGVEHIFGNPGSTELTMLAGLPDELDYVLCLHENVAVAAAAGYSSLSGRPSLVNVHTLPGVANASGAIATAAANRSPVVVTAGQQDTRHLRTEPMLSGPMEDFARPLVKWSHQPVRAEDVPAAFERAFRVAMTPPRGPVFLSLPMDYFEAEVSARPRVDVPVLGGALREHDLGQLLDSLTSAASVALVTGPDVETYGAWGTVIELAARLDADVFAAPQAARFGFPTDHVRYKGQLLAKASSIHADLEPYDRVLVVGGPGFTLYPYTEHDLMPSGTAATLLTNAAEDASKFEYGNSLLCDIAAVTAALVDSLPPSPAPADGESQRRQPSPSSSDVLDTPSVCQEIREVFGLRFTHLDESVSNGPSLRRHLPRPHPDRYLRSSNGGLGSVLPTAIGAALANPDEPAVVTIGDGSLMYSPQALWTIAQRDLPVKVIVLNNQRYQILRDFHASSFAHLGSMVASELPGLDVQGLGASLGVPSRSVQTREELRGALEEASATSGPALLDVQLSGDSPSMFED